ncbi:hypothetical protein C8R44DRAFT_895143 [Mycena epipterygia]|nr:hypothetical protein C8R44DRAFT_895143 [Mycena epipterygia]
MAPITNKRVLLTSIPEGYPIPGETTVCDTSETIDPETVSLNGGFLLKTLVLSVNPYMRGSMRSSDIPSYLVAFKIGFKAMASGSCCDLRTRTSRLDNMFTAQNFEYSILLNATGLTFLEKDHKLPWTVYVGVAGMPGMVRYPGQTAYMGWKEYSHAKKIFGETVFVTTGAGPVGSMVIQLAKRDGLKVIASAGSEEKVQFMKDIGADVVFNYKTTDTREVLAREGPIDVYWDNVGGASCHPCALCFTRTNPQ